MNDENTFEEQLFVYGPTGGVAGPQGTIGAQGTQGVVGQGIAGNQGLQGTDGTQGFLGAQGNQGIVGDGPPGVQGNQGWQGDLGIGAQGSQGGNGAQGSQGGNGAQGSQGRQGAAAGGNTQYYTGTPQSINNTTAIVYSLVMQGEIGDMFKIFMSGDLSGSFANITAQFDNTWDLTYQTGANASSWTYEITGSITSASSVWMSSTGDSSGAISPSPTSTFMVNKFGAGSRPFNMVAGVPLTITLQHNNIVSINMFSIIKYAAAFP